MTLFDYLEAYRMAVNASLDEMEASLAEGAMAAATPELDAASGSPADAWLSGHEWAGEAEVGGMAMSSGTWDTSGEGAHVISVDGEVLDLPPY